MAQIQEKTDNEKKHELISHWAQLFLSKLDDKLTKSLDKTN